MSEAKKLFEIIQSADILSLAQTVGAEREYNALLESGRSLDNRDMISNRIWLKGVAHIASRPELFQTHDDQVFSASAIKILLDFVKFGPEYRSLQNTIRRFFQQDIVNSDIPERLNSWTGLSIHHREALIIDVINTICNAADGVSQDFQGLKAIPLADEEEPKAKDVIEVDYYDFLPAGHNGFAWGETLIGLNKSLIASNDVNEAVVTACFRRQNGTLTNTRTYGKQSCFQYHQELTQS